MLGRLGLAALTIQQARQLFMRRQLVWPVRLIVAPKGDLALDVVAVAQALGQSPVAPQPVRSVLRQPAQVDLGGGGIVRGRKQIGQALVGQSIVRGQGVQTAPGGDRALGVAELILQPGQAKGRPCPIRVAFGQDFQVRQGRSLALAEQVDQRRMGLQIALVELDQPFPGRDSPGNVAQLFEQPGKTPAGCRPIGAALGQDAEVRQGRVGLAQQLDQAVMRFEVVGVELEHPFPGLGGVLPGCSKSWATFPGLSRPGNG